MEDGGELSFSAKEREEDGVIPGVRNGPRAGAELRTPQTEVDAGAQTPASKHSSPWRLGLSALPGWGRQGTKEPRPCYCVKVSKC